MTEKQYDIAIIGAGPAGLMAATVAAQAGAAVLLLERQEWAGGRLGLQTQLLQGPDSIYKDMSGIDFCRRLLDDAVSSGADVMLGTEISGLNRLPSDGFELASPSIGAIRARSVILAAGSWEPWFDFPGSRLPGVMLSGDAQEMLNVRGKLPGQRVLIVGSDNAGLLIAANLRDAGAEVVAIVDESPRIVGREFNAAPLRDAGVSLLTSTRVAAEGSQQVESVCLTDASGKKHRFDVDTVCLAGPRTPESALAVLAGCPLREHNILGGPVPVHDRRMATTVTGLYVCGDAAGVENGAVSLESGRIAGLRAAQDQGHQHPQAEAMQNLARARLGHLRRGSRGLLRRKAKAALASEHQRLSKSPPG